MTDNPPHATTDSGTDSLTDLETLGVPTRLREHREVRYVEHTETHADADHCRAHSQGMAVVGITAADGSVLVATHLEEPVALLPNARLEDDEDWLTAAERAVETLTDDPIDVGAPVLVRELEHVLGRGDTPHTTSFTVVFEASPVAESTPDELTARTTCTWEGAWIERVPDGCVGTPERPMADMRLFLE
ncbi:hypothetical protein ACLI4Y_13670 [Natrialbaceae archaeon A-CW3]